MRAHGRASSKQKTRSLWSSHHGMHLLIALLVATAACALARPPGPTVIPANQAHGGLHSERAPLPPVRDYLGEILLPRLLLPNFMGYEDSPRVPPPQLIPEHDWLNKEIDRINQMEDDDESYSPYDVDLAHWIAQDPYLQHVFETTMNDQDQSAFVPESLRSSSDGIRPLSRDFTVSAHVIPELLKSQHALKRRPSKFSETSKDQSEMFALTPLDKGYYDFEIKDSTQFANREDVDPKMAMIMQPPRQIRQNPHLGRAKTLVAENLDKLREGLPYEEGDATDKPRHIHVLETTAADPAESIYGVALIAAVGAALTIAIFGFAFGWYTLSKKAKAAADVDYPAYGVTGPTIDTSGDRKLAHSAHMYHYQHQKQQIIAMERNGLEQRNGSVSDPESEEENEEGDYTVYECPGFATTGDMEVKNPLFSDEPTPATPGKCEMVKPQPKD